MISSPDVNKVAMILYDITNRAEQAKVRPAAYRLKNCRERLASYSNHMTFLTKCRTHGIIPQGLWVILPVRFIQADNMAERTGHALV